MSSTLMTIERHLRPFLSSLLVPCLAVVALAGGTRTWEQTRFEEFAKGTAKGVAISSGGSLLPAPAFDAVVTSPSTYLWAVAADGKGNVFAAAGAPARVYRISAAGKLTVVFKPQELQVQSLAVDGKGVVYAATSPDGKVYRIERKSDAKPAQSQPAESKAGDTSVEVPSDPEYAAAEFFDPKTKYIWDLALDSEGRLYVATGDRGEIFRVNPDGKGAVFFKSDEAHIRVLAFDATGQLLAGSDGSGLIYRISPSGEGFVLYSARKKEITALAVDAQGNIYAAGLGEKRSAPTVLQPFPQPAVPVTTPQPPTAGVTVQVTTQPQAPPPVVLPSTAGVPGGSDVYRIAADGSPHTLWSSPRHVVYALAFDRQGRLLAGTGNDGRLFAIAADGSYTDLVKASATQITALAPMIDGTFYAATSNLGKVFRMSTAPAAEASFESDVLDARNVSRWGRAEARGTGRFELWTRSGNVDNPDRNWSPWKKVGVTGMVDAPPARFLQWKLVLEGGSAPGRVESVTVAYRPKNVAPEVDEVAVQAGARFPTVPKPPVDNQPVVVGAPPPGAAQQRFEPPPPPAQRDRNSVAARWKVTDDNDDDLEFTLYYRGDGESRWKLLDEKLTDKVYSWEAGRLPDGGYKLKVVACDLPSNAPDEALCGEKESPRFELDATPPRVENLKAVVEAGKARVTFLATDTFSPVLRAEYSVDGADWKRIEPADGIADSLSESFDVAIPVTAGEEHSIVVRAYDKFDNAGSAKVVVK
ncbi:MAG TPA: hypothetical protein VLE48_13665 [Terriglobales bacterium]|nr:hypothetical protein [Terriglobales bacterium]